MGQPYFVSFATATPNDLPVSFAGTALRELLGGPTSISVYTNDVAPGLAGTGWAEEWIYERNLPWSSTWVNIMLTNGSVSYIGGDRFP